MTWRALRRELRRLMRELERALARQRDETDTISSIRSLSPRSRRERSSHPESESLSPASFISRATIIRNTYLRIYLGFYVRICRTTHRDVLHPVNWLCTRNHHTPRAIHDEVATTYEIYCYTKLLLYALLCIICYNFIRW